MEFKKRVLKSGCIMLLLFISYKGLAQEVTQLSGRVTDSTNLPLEGCIVTLFTDSTRQEAIAYTLTDANGHFKGSFGSRKALFISVSLLGYRSFEQLILWPRQKLTIVLNHLDAIELEEVIVRAETVKDTVGVNTKNLRLTDHSTLRDILDRTEGFMVTKEGGISYKGVPINKILINKKEVFVNQNKVALDHLNYEIMDSLQVINNYKDRFDINFNNFTAPVLNIDAKKKFTGVFKPVLSASTGYKDAFQILPKALFFSDKFNLFFTGNINNTGEKDFSSNDVLAPIVHTASGYYQSLFRPFFSDDDLLKKDKNNNIFATLRQEGKKSKNGFSVYYNHINREKEIVLTSALATSGQLAKRENTNLQDIGRLATISYDHNRLLSHNFGLVYNLDVSTIDDKNSHKQDIEFYLPNSLSMNLNSQLQTAGSLISNSVNFKILTRKKFLIAPKIQYTSQKSYYDMTTNIVRNQQIDFYRNKLDALLSLRYQRNSLLTFEAKPQIAIIDDKNKFATHSTQRKVNQFTPTISIQGQNKKLNYFLSVGTQSYFDQHKALNAKTLSILDLLTEYMLTPSSRLTLKMNKKNELIDFSTLVDTLNNGVNSRLLTQNISPYTITQNFSTTLGYYYSDVIKSRGFNLSVNYAQNNNSVQGFFSSIDSNNVYHYQNVVTPASYTFVVKTGLGKSYYLSPKSHKLNIRTNLSYHLDDIPYLNPGSKYMQRYNSKSIIPNAEISFLHNGSITSEIRLLYVGTLKWVTLSEQNYRYQTHLLGTEIFCRNEKLEIKTTLFYTLIRNQSYNFNTPLLNIAGTYKISEKLSVSIKGKSLIDLFGQRDRDFTNYQLYPEGILVNEIFNRFRIGYLMTGLTFKF